jgi:hypothetical protein
LINNFLKKASYLAMINLLDLVFGFKMGGKN